MNLSDLAKYSMTRSISHDLSATAELLVTHPSLVWSPRIEVLLSSDL